MAVGIRLKLAGVTAEQMDQLNAAIDPEGNPPDGLIFHASGPIEAVLARSTSGSRASTSTDSPQNASDPRWPPSALRVHRTFTSSPVHEHFPR